VGAHLFLASQTMGVDDEMNRQGRTTPAAKRAGGPDSIPCAPGAVPAARCPPRTVWCLF